MSDIKMSDDKVEFLAELATSGGLLCKRAATSLSCAWSEIAEQQQEIAELNAVIGCHRNELRKIADLESVSQDECSWMAEQALSALPAQCLASIKADAVDDFIKPHWSPTIATQDLIDYAKKLREQKS
jgi:hypothetical protein